MADSVAESDDDTNNGDTGHNTGDNGYHLEIISSVTGPLCYCSRVLGPSSRSIQFVVTDISIIQIGSILICLLTHIITTVSSLMRGLRELLKWSGHQDPSLFSDEIIHTKYVQVKYLLSKDPNIVLEVREASV